MSPHLSTPWRKSTRSSTSNCVEVAFTTNHTVLIRDSKDAAGPRLTVSPAAWTGFATPAGRWKSSSRELPE
ncbi:DUF397 domain-containing protein [Catenuloplanes indicus]|nr:DUF397 domain-containing protein [Catenuloplanes indicus]